MTGRYDHGIDAKGRLTIPSQLRKELGEVCYVVRGPKKYLNVYSAQGWQRFCDRFADKTQSRDGDLMRFLMANASTCEIDAQGRILLTAELREYAEIDKSITLVGLPDRAEIWSSENYRAAEAAYFEKMTMADIYEELGL